MCGIGLIQKKDLYSTLLNQRIRGLDGIGIIDIKEKTLYKAYKGGTLIAYEEYIQSTFEESEDMCFLHHRAASIGKIGLDNTHPFQGKKFLLAQNGTSKELFKQYGKGYGKETDSETLLSMLEDGCDTLEECIEELDLIADTLGIIFIFHKGRILIYADACRGSYVDAYDIKFQKKKTKSYLRSFTNLKANSTSEYRNGFFMVIDSTTFEILSEWNYEDDGRYNVDHWYSFSVNGIAAQKKTRVTKDKKTGPGFYPSTNYAGTGCVPKKNRRIGGLSSEQKSAQKMNKLLTTITDASLNYLPEDMLSEADTFSIIGEYGLSTIMNDDMQTTMSTDLFKFIKGDTYINIFNSIDTDIFNSKEKNDDLYVPIHIDFLFIVPLKYLVSITLQGGKQVSIQLTRHVRFLTTLVGVELANYYYGLQYFVDKLNAENFGLKLSTVRSHELTVETYLHLTYEEGDGLKQSIPFVGGGVSKSYDDAINGFARAAYVLGLKAFDINMEKNLFYTLTSKY